MSKPLIGGLLALFVLAAVLVLLCSPLGLSVRFVLLLALHYVADYWLQSGASSRLKRDNTPAVRWCALLQHGAVHGVFVGLVTGWPLLGFCEMLAHACIDRAKARGFVGTAGDQVFHVICKIYWVALLGAMT